MNFSLTVSVLGSSVYLGEPAAFLWKLRGLFALVFHFSSSSDDGNDGDDGNGNANTLECRCQVDLQTPNTPTPANNNNGEPRTANGLSLSQRDKSSQHSEPGSQAVRQWDRWTAETVGQLDSVGQGGQWDIQTDRQQRQWDRQETGKSRQLLGLQLRTFQCDCTF